MNWNAIQKVGIVVADVQEFVAVKERFRPLPSSSVLPFEAAELVMEREGRTIVVRAVRCGIGKVNAASAAAFLIAWGADWMMGYGLSGAVHGVRKGETVFGQSFVEYDFDLTALGRPFGYKPDQDAWLYEADPQMLEFAQSVYPRVRLCHVATGDRFLADGEFQKTLIGDYDAVCCEMESAAIASVCHKSGIPFLSIRVMSDDADGNAVDDYNAENKKAEASALEMALHLLEETLRRKCE